MANLITRVRLLVNDPSGAGQIFDDQTIQDTMDESRVDIGNEALQAVPSFSGSTIQYLDYYYPLGGWEDGVVLKQYLTTVVTPSASEPIAGHWAFSTSKLPPIYITGSVHDVYRAAADLLERWAAKWVLSYDFSSDGQSFHRSQAAVQLQKLAATYRLKQRAGMIIATRSDLASPEQSTDNALAARPIDYFSSGQGS